METFCAFHYVVRKITTLPHTPSSCQRASVERVAAHLRGSACQVITNDRLADLNIHYLLEVADPLYRSLSPRVTRVGGKPVNNSDHFGITRQQVRRGRNLGLVVAGFELMGQRNNIIGMLAMPALLSRGSLPVNPAAVVSFAASI